LLAKPAPAQAGVAGVLNVLTYTLPAPPPRRDIIFDLNGNLNPSFFSPNNPKIITGAL